ncbi:uncharacterized protein LOC141653568 isoform X3 [Silene latifolia]|uniref:uncharacterized protein LOC141653568 isoform X3 n=1 Tax=Silene latifolia TaxID=37657 RepID=UPI003D7730E1
MPNPINRGRGRMGRLRGPQNLQKLGVAFREAKSVNNNLIKRCRGRPRGTGQLEQQFEVRKNARLVQPTEPHLLDGTCIVSEKEEMVPSGAPLQRCSSAQLVLINSPTESSAIPSTCTEPLTGDNGVISKHGVNGEKRGASQEQRGINPHPLAGGQCSSEDITNSYTMLSGGLVQNDYGSCLNSEDMSWAQLRVLETGTGQLQPNIVIVSGLLAVNPSMEKQKPAKPMPNLINRGRGRIGRLRTPRNLQKLGGQLEQQFEVRKSARLIQPTEPHLLAGTCIVSEKEEMVPSGAPLQWCSSAQLVLINSPTEPSAIPSTCTEPFTGDNGGISEKPDATQEQRRINPHPLPGGGQCSSEDITKSYPLLSGGLVQNDFGTCLNSKDMSRTQLRVLETGTGQLQPNIVIVSGLLVVNPSMEKQKPSKPMPNLINRGRGRIGRLRKLQKLGAQMNAALQSDIHYFHRPVTRSVDPSMEKQKSAKPMPSPINRGRGRIGRLLGPRKLQKLGVAFREAKSVNNNLTKRGRGRPRGTGRRQNLRAQLEQQFEVTKSARLVQPTAEPHSLAGTWFWNVTSSRVLINSPTESSAIPSTCTEPLSGDNGVISTHGVKVAFREAKSVNNNLTKRGRGRPRGTGRRQILRAQLEQQSEVLVQPTETHLRAGTCMVSEKEEMMPGGAPLRRCSSAQFILINSSTESCAVPSTCTEPLSGDNGVISKHGAKGETPGASQEHSRINPQPLPGGDQCSNEANNNKEWDSASLMKAIINKHGDITKSLIDGNVTMEHPLHKQNMDAPDTLPENGRRGSLNCVGGSKKQKAQGKLFTSTSMFPEEAAQQKPISKADVLCNGSEQIPDLDMGTFLASDSKKMMLGGGTSVQTTLVESSGENPYWLRTHSNLEENDMISGTQIEDILAGASGGSVSKTGENSGIHLDLQPTEGPSQFNTSHCENDCPYDADLCGMMSETSLLQTIYTKYGDITQGCDLNSETFKKSCLLGICRVVQKLQVTSIDDISSDDMAELYSTVKDADNLKLDVKWLHQRLVEIEESMRSRDKLKTMEEAKGAITLEEEKLRKRLAMNKLKITRLEHEIEMLREEQTAKKSRCEEVKARTENIKSAYHSCPKYLIDWLL